VPHRRTTIGMLGACGASARTCTPSDGVGLVWLVGLCVWLVGWGVFFWGSRPLRALLCSPTSSQRRPRRTTSKSPRRGWVSHRRTGHARGAHPPPFPPCRATCAVSRGSGHRVFRRLQTSVEDLEPLVWYPISYVSDRRGSQRLLDRPCSPRPEAASPPFRCSDQLFSTLASRARPSATVDILTAATRRANFPQAFCSGTVPGPPRASF